MGSIFGGGGGGGGGQPQTSTSTTTQELSPEQKKLMALVIPSAEKFIASPPTLYGPSTVQGFDPLQTQAQQNVLNLAAPGSSLNNYVDSAVGGSQFLTSGSVLSPGNNPALQQSINSAIQPLLDNFTNKVLPSIRSGAVAAGGFGGSRQGIAEGLASQGLSQEVGRVSSGMANQNYQSGLSAMSSALLGANKIASLPFISSKILGAVGQQRQQVEQAKLNEQAKKFMAAQLIPFSTAQDVAAMAFGMPGGSVQSKSTYGSSGSSGGGGGLLSILSSFAGPLASNFL